MGGVIRSLVVAAVLGLACVTDAYSQECGYKDRWPDHPVDMQAPPLGISQTQINALMKQRQYSESLQKLIAFERLGMGDDEQSSDSRRFRRVNALAWARTMIGIHYFRGLAVERDFAASARWFQSGLNTNYTNSQGCRVFGAALLAPQFLGIQHYYGLGVPRSIQEARRYWEMDRMINGAFLAMLDANMMPTSFEAFETADLRALSAVARQKAPSKQTAEQQNQNALPLGRRTDNFKVICDDDPHSLMVIRLHLPQRLIEIDQGDNAHAFRCRQIIQDGRVGPLVKPGSDCPSLQAIGVLLGSDGLVGKQKVTVTDNAVGWSHHFLATNGEFTATLNLKNLVLHWRLFNSNLQTQCKLDPQ